MAPLHRTCPECRTPLSLSRVPRGGKVRCPICDAVIDCTDDDSDDGVQPRAGAGRSAARRARPADPDDDDADRFVRKPSVPIALGPILVGVSLGLLGLFILGGALGVLWITSSRDADNAPAVAAAADGPGAPVAIADPAPAPPRDPIGPAPDNGAAPVAGALPLQELKAATVYIKNTTANVGRATGSGFVVRSQGDTVWVVTNHHVVAPLKPEEMPGRGFRGRPRFPARPGAAELTVVFRSGTPAEQSLRAAVVADDARNDLAVLKLDGVRDAPRPIDCKRSPELRETLPIWAFGFPFGAALDPSHRNPAITVTKGTVTSLRLDARGELSLVQIGGGLNPGNSGGPVVDDTGALIGVAVAKIDGADGIGFAVPVRLLNQLLDTRAR